MFGKKNDLLLVLVTFFTILFLGFNGLVFAQESPILAKDADLDGITDSAEVEKYKTDPNNADTDGDTILDYQEVVDGSDPLNAKSNIIEHAKASTSFLPEEGFPIFWYIGRIAGIASFIMFTLVVVFGLLMTSKFLLRFRIFSAADALETHSFNATFIALTLVIVHISSFLFDDVLRMSLSEAFIPFVLRRPELRSAVGLELTLPIALGIFAFYIAILLVTTSKLRKKLVPLNYGEQFII